MSLILQCHRKLQGAINWLIGLALAVLILVILLQTFTRYVVFYSLPWSEELSRYLYVLMIMLGINIGITNDGFVRIDVIDYFVSDRVKSVLGVYRDIVILAVSVVFFYSTIGLAKIGAFQKSPAMQIRMSVMYYVLMIGFALCIVSAALKLVGKFGGHGPAVESRPETTEGGEQQ